MNIHLDPFIYTAAIPWPKQGQVDWIDLSMAIEQWLLTHVAQGQWRCTTDSVSFNCPGHKLMFVMAWPNT